MDFDNWIPSADGRRRPPRGAERVVLPTLAVAGGLWLADQISGVALAALTAVLLVGWLWALAARSHLAVVTVPARTTAVSPGRILDALPDPVMVVDRHRVVVAANQRALDLLGDKLVGRDLALSVRHPEILNAVEAALGGKAGARSAVSMTAGVARHYEVHAATLPEDAGIGGRAVLALHDITVVKSAEKMRADFVANVSHELRSPLSSLLGFIETLKGPARDDEEARERFLDIMDGEAQRMTRLIDDLLSLSRVEAGEHLAPEDKVDLKALIGDVLSSLGPRAAEREVSLRVDLAEDLAPVIGSHDELEEVFHNLIDNAIKYGGGAPVTVSAVGVARIPDVGGAGVAVTVADRGPGIAAKHIPRLTERFYRVDKGRSRSMGGTGLGLAIVKHIVNRHRGRMTVDSTVGEGTAFTVFLPTAEAG